MRNTPHKNTVSRIQLGIGLFFILIGLLIFLKREFDLSLRPYLFPIALLCLGSWMIFGDRARGKWGLTAQGAPTSPPSSEPTVNEGYFANSTAIFSENHQIIQKKGLKGVGVVSLFGSSLIDFSQIHIDELHSRELHVDVFQLFGGTTLLVPADWIVESDVLCLFGDVRHQNTQTLGSRQAALNLYLHGQSVFGSITIKRIYP